MTVPGDVIHLPPLSPSPFLVPAFLACGLKPSPLLTMLCFPSGEKRMLEQPGVKPRPLPPTGLRCQNCLIHGLEGYRDGSSPPSPRGSCRELLGTHSQFFFFVGKVYLSELKLATFLAFLTRYSTGFLPTVQAIVLQTNFCLFVFCLISFGVKEVLLFLRILLSAHLDLFGPIYPPP